MLSILLFLHLAGVAVWVGGMFFAHFCLRPVAVAQLPPAQRLPLMAAVLGRFFKAVLLALVLILVTGFSRLGMTGFAQAPAHWHAMATTGLLMSLIFALIYFRLFPRLTAAVEESAWPAAAVALDGIRRLVVVNLGLGTLTIAIAAAGGLLAG